MTLFSKKWILLALAMFMPVAGVHAHKDNPVRQLCDSLSKNRFSDAGTYLSEIQNKNALKEMAPALYPDCTFTKKVTRSGEDGGPTITTTRACNNVVDVVYKKREEAIKARSDLGNVNKYHLPCVGLGALLCGFVGYQLCNAQAAAVSALIGAGIAYQGGCQYKKSLTKKEKNNLENFMKCRNVFCKLTEKKMAEGVFQVKKFAEELEHLNYRGATPYSWVNASKEIFKRKIVGKKGPITLESFPDMMNMGSFIAQEKESVKEKTSGDRDYFDDISLSMPCNRRYVGDAGMGYKVFLCDHTDSVACGYDLPGEPARSDSTWSWTSLPKNIDRNSNEYIFLETYIDFNLEPNGCFNVDDGNIKQHGCFVRSK